jgi:F-type H+-transporting ATPase subunit alpha
MVNINSPFATAFAAFTSLSSFSSNSPVFTAGFALTTPKQFSGRSNSYHHTRWNPLSSAVVDEHLDQDSVSDSNNIIYDAPDKIVARADVLSFYPSSNGKSGIMAIKIREEDYESDLNLSQTQEQQETSSTGMFGGNISDISKGNTVTGSSKTQQGEDFVGKAVRLSGGRRGTIVAQRPPMAFVQTDFNHWSANDTEEEKVVTILGSRTSVSVSNTLFGSIVDCYGKAIDYDIKMDQKDVVKRAIFPPIPKVSDIALINSPLLTGTAMVDALTPIGKGQNMLIIGQDTGVGQRDIAISAIKAQVKSKKVKCIYALTTENKKERESVLNQLKDAGVLDDIVVVVARDRPEQEGLDCVQTIDACEAITVAASACSIAEALALSQGEDTFVIVDDIDQHKIFWDWTTRVLVDVYGIDAIVQDDKEGGASSEMRGFYSTLIQRAAQWNEKNGGGSMTLVLITNLAGNVGGIDEEDITFTAEDFVESSEKVKARIKILTDKGIPLTPETLRKIQIPLPSASESERKRRLALQHSDDLISMSDGQIWLDETLYKSGQRPAMDAQKSITRIGVGADTNSRADAPAFRSLVGGLRFDFAQASALDGAQANSGADKLTLKKEAYLLGMHQELGAERSLGENCVVLLAASMRKLDKIIQDGGKAGTELGQTSIDGLVEHVRKYASNQLEEIDTTLDMTPETRKQLEVIIDEYFSS